MADELVQGPLLVSEGFGPYRYADRMLVKAGIVDKVIDTLGAAVLAAYNYVVAVPIHLGERSCFEIGIAEFVKKARRDAGETGDVSSCLVREAVVQDTPDD